MATNQWYGWQWHTSGTAATTYTLTNDNWSWHTGTTSNITLDPRTVWVFDNVTYTSSNGYMYAREWQKSLTPEKKQKRLQRMWERWVSAAESYWRGYDAKVKKAEAENRARKLLLEHLTEDQRQMLEEKKRFHVHTADGLRTYEIAIGSHGNIKMVRDKGEELTRPRRFCSYARGHYPVEDGVLAQKLMIEYEEENFLAVANEY